MRECVRSCVNEVTDSTPRDADNSAPCEFNVAFVTLRSAFFCDISASVY